MKILQLRFIMTALAAILDPFEEVLRVSISEVERTENIAASTDRLIAVARALLWKALFCAVPHVKG